MTQLNTLTSDSTQAITFTLSDGSTVELLFNYLAVVRRWSLNVEYKEFKANGVGISTHPNMLRVWRNTIPFGLKIETDDGTDPFLADDLESKRVRVFVLDNTGDLTDVDDVEEEVFQ